MAAALSLPPKNYIVDRNPLQYGGHQEDFVRQSAIVIEKVTRQIQECIGSSADLTTLFFKVLGELAETRRSIAIEHSTSSAEIFGRRRDLELGTNHIGFFASTLLNKVYIEYGKQILERLHDLLYPKRTPHDFIDACHCIEEVALGKVSKYSCAVLDKTALLKLQWVLPLNLEELIDAISPIKPDIHCSSAEEFTDNKEAMLALKERNPDLYKRVKMYYFLCELALQCPPPGAHGADTYHPVHNTRTHYVLGINRLEIEGKLYALSQHLTWLHVDYKEDPLERMRDHSTVMVIHQDPFLIETTLHEIAKIFKRAVLWSSETSTVKELKETVGLFRYTFAHCMPFCRGSAAVGEWLESSIYRYHGFAGFVHTNTASGDLEALCARTLSEFLTAYDSTIDLGISEE